MIIAITQFRLPQPLTQEEARQVFLSTAPGYRDMPGLVRKQYVVWEDGRTVGGVYLWNSRAEAEAQYSDAWRAFVREKYGTEPSITYLDNLVTVENGAGSTVSH